MERVMPGQFYADFGGKGYLKNGMLEKKNSGTPRLQSQECRYTRFSALFAMPVEEIQQLRFVAAHTEEAEVGAVGDEDQLFGLLGELE